MVDLSSVSLEHFYLFQKTARRRYLKLQQSNYYFIRDNNDKYFSNVIIPISIDSCTTEIVKQTRET